MSAKNGISTDAEGNVKVMPPTASASARAGEATVEAGDGPPPYIVYIHDGKPVLYQIYEEG